MRIRMRCKVYKRIDEDYVDIGVLQRFIPVKSMMDAAVDWYLIQLMSICMAHEKLFPVFVEKERRIARLRLDSFLCDYGKCILFLESNGLSAQYYNCLCRKLTQEKDNLQTHADVHNLSDGFIRYFCMDRFFDVWCMEQYDLFLDSLKKDFHTIAHHCDEETPDTTANPRNPLWDNVVQFMQIIHDELS